MATDALTKDEKTTLGVYEAIVKKGVNSFVEVGNALARIRDGRLYRETHERFEDYCQQKWDLSRVHVHRLIVASEVVESVLPIGNTAPANEAQVRPLTQLDSTEERQEAWQEAVETAPTDENDKPVVTARHVADVVAKRVRKTKPVAEETATAVAEPVAEPPRVETDRVETLIAVRDEIAESFAPSPKRYDVVTTLNKGIDLVRILEGRE